MKLYFPIIKPPHSNLLWMEISNSSLQSKFQVVIRFCESKKHRPSLCYSQEEMNFVQRKIYLYNVTFGLYMLEWWERYLFNILIIVLLWFVCYNGSRFAAEFYKSHLKVKLGV
ncbi:hypothetical protein MKW98_005494 [Papaver atlanticum]|uniref:Uncharacterized protein n=1 Tax=Papaver atlanticum TaxID=357466 RepID=A0AAD4T8V7_9MAGN|nr:hypothetical protein MKW98_005494 [Papaver atlanticum]